ncbi:DUF885 domain-containing protein [uncultured Paraglaciecola sp.]|mgnify:CR=1 FL=1|uniref:DUF885 domain-containing protein n=1 Tax=uncultured Paraglaciecola sp. TaxID=1765024 RepID=UPI0030D6F3BB|tara:strand:- start:17887 stop:19635 length:1749 start_codon:yes stop_codon:yes gene_type:complete
MKKLSSLLVFSLFSYMCLATETAKLQTLLDKIWQYELSVSPIQASQQGRHEFDDKLTDISPKALAERDTQFREYLKKLTHIDSAELSRTQQISLLIQQRKLQNHIDQYRFNAHYMPLTSESGFHNDLAFLPRSSRFKTLVDYQNYLTRLEQFPSYFEQQIKWMKKGIQTGMVQPKVVLHGFEDSIKSFIHQSPEDSVFYTPFTDFQGSSVDPIQQQNLREQASLVISNQVFSAYQTFYDFFTTEYFQNSKANIAAKSLPKGVTFYQNRSDFYTTTKMSVEDIHTLGLQEVKRIRGEMQSVIEQLEFDGDIYQFIEFLRNDKQFYAQTADELIKQAAYIAKKMDAKLPQLFNYLPRTPYGVEAVPENIAPKYTTGRYISPNRDDQPGYYWVNTYALDKRPLYALTALTLHEAVPGHHLQISLAREMQDLPEVRRYTYISAFGEGWGLYSEFLGKEVGMYQDPYDEFGRLSYEMWRACRLVVDTGMHIKGWSRQQAIDFMLENTALSEHNVTTEIDRYISWPAQALSYKIGEITIKKLRHKAEHALGDKFDVRAFHHAILEHGSVPLSILEDSIQLFIQEQTQS